MVITKRAIKLGGVALVLGVTGVMLNANTSRGEIDLPGINNRIDNLDARVTNVESDVEQLQGSTGTAPGTHVDVPAVTGTTSQTLVTTTATSGTVESATATPTPSTPQPTAKPAPTRTAASRCWTSKPASKVGFTEWHSWLIETYSDGHVVATNDYSTQISADGKAPNGDLCANNQNPTSN